MPDIWIDSNASGTNAGTSWTDAYADSKAYLAGTPSTDDEIWYAHNHSVSYTEASIMQFPAGAKLYSVNSGTDEYQAGAEEYTTGAYDISAYSTSGVSGLFIMGVSFKSGNDIKMSQAPNLFTSFEDSTLELTGGSATDRFLINLDGAEVRLKNVDVVFATAGQLIQIGGGAILRVDGGSTNSIATRFIDSLGSGGLSAYVSNHNFFAMSSGQLVNLTSFNDDVVNVVFNRCKKQTVVDLVNGIYSRSQTVDAYSCDTGDGYHYFEHHRYEGVVLESTTVKRTGGAHYDQANPTTTLFSAEFQPNANVIAYTQPLRVPIKHFELDLTTPVKTLTFHLAFADDTSPITAFNNDEAWIEIVQNSTVASSKALGKTISTKPADILATSTALTASTEAWVSNATTLELDYTYTDKRQIAVDTEIVSGMANGQITAYLCIAKYPNATLEIFVCPDPVIT